jgi:hypothetical protein
VDRLGRRVRVEQTEPLIPGEVGLPGARALQDLVQEALTQLGGTAHRRALMQRALEIGGFSAEQRALPPPPSKREQYKSQLDYRLSWALHHLHQSGAIERVEPSVWRLRTAVPPSSAGRVEGGEARGAAESDAPDAATSLADLGKQILAAPRGERMTAARRAARPTLNTLRQTGGRVLAQAVEVAKDAEIGPSGFIQRGMSRRLRLRAGGRRR